MIHSGLRPRQASAEERQRQILDLATDYGSVRILELQSSFGVSEVTLRHDLDVLAERGLLVRTHGGAVTSVGTPLDIEFSKRQRLQEVEKQRIGRAAARLIGSGETVLFDGGSTTLQVARATRNLDDVILITVGLNIAGVLASRNPHSTVMLLAGEINRRTLAVEGPRTAKSLAELNIDKLLASTFAIDIEKGLTDVTIAGAETKRALIEASHRVIVVADSSKFGDVAFATVAPISVVDVVVSDAGLSPQMKQDLEALGIEVILA